MTTLASPGSNKTAMPEAGKVVAELRSLTKTYFKPDGSIMVEALRSVDLSIPRGQYLAIMGASGSGKSTLMNVLGCLDRPTSGKYLVAGRDVGEMDDEELSLFRGESIGFVFQAFNLIPQLTVEGNVEVPLFYQQIHKAERHRRAMAALETVGLADRTTHRPSELSGGQQQRVAIARALVTRPLILLADEPTGNLDTATGEAVLATVEHLHAEGMTVIMVTHDDEVSARCQRIIRLRDGSIESDSLPG
jgi:putative ABC transport system ATP-binding protein